MVLIQRGNFLYFILILFLSINKGQVHLAEVTSVNNDTKTITVEWNEGEEIKGKEVR